MKAERFELDTSKLKAGMLVKNYRQLCAMIGQEPTTGCSKQSQIANWERFFAFEKQGVKYLIKEVYDEPLAKRYSSRYAQKIEDILMLEFALRIYDKHKQLNDDVLQTIKSDGKQIKICETITTFLNTLGLVNANFKEDKFCFNIQEIAPLLKFLGNDIIGYTRQVMNRALDILQDREFICHRHSFIVVDEECLPRPASDDERETILEVEKQVLKEMNVDNTSIVHLQHRNKRFYKKTSLILRKKFGWVGYVPAHEVSLLSKGVEQSLKSVVEKYFPDGIEASAKAIDGSDRLVAIKGAINTEIDHIKSGLVEYLLENILEDNNTRSASLWKSIVDTFEAADKEAISKQLMTVKEYSDDDAFKVDGDAFYTNALTVIRQAFIRRYIDIEQPTESGIGETIIAKLREEAIELYRKVFKETSEKEMLFII